MASELRLLEFVFAALSKLTAAGAKQSFALSFCGTIGVGIVLAR